MAHFLCQGCRRRFLIKKSDIMRTFYERLVLGTVEYERVEILMR